MCTWWSRSLLSIGLMARPNQRMKLSARGGRSIRNRSVLIAAAPGRQFKRESLDGNIEDSL